MARPGALAHLRRQRRKRDSEIGGSLPVAPVMGGRTRHGRQTAALLRRARARRRRAARRDARERRCCPSSGAGADRALEHGADTRHSGTGCRPIVLSMSASVGFGIAVSSVAAARIWPDWQSPHFGVRCSIQACGSAWRLSGWGPSIAVTSRPSTMATAVRQERMAVPSTRTVQAPHGAIPQPCFVSVRSSASRRAHSRGRSGSVSRGCRRPFSARVIGVCDPGRGFRKACLLRDPRRGQTNRARIATLQRRRQDTSAVRLGQPPRGGAGSRSSKRPSIRLSSACTSVRFTISIEPPSWSSRIRCRNRKSSAARTSIRTSPSHIP